MTNDLEEEGADNQWNKHRYSYARVFKNADNRRVPA